MFMFDLINFETFLFREASKIYVGVFSLNF